MDFVAQRLPSLQGILMRRCENIVCGVLCAVLIWFSAATAQDARSVEPPDGKALGEEPIELDEPRPEPLRRMATTEEAIAFFKARTERNQRDFLSRTILGRLYIRLARESGEESHYGRAEAVLNEALRIKPDHVTARTYMAAVLLAGHKFAEALEMARGVREQDSQNLDALATIGDACLEMGRYEEAEEAYRALEKAAPVPEVHARLAHLAELRGETEKAISLMQGAAERERAWEGTQKELAWYEFRLGELRWSEGQLDEAAGHFETALQERKDYAPALMGLARVRAAQERYDEAVKLFAEAVARKPEFDTVAELAELHARAGNAAEAARLEAQVEDLLKEALKIDTEGRHLSLYLADRGEQLDLAVELARKDFEVRQDVYAYDTLAWALFKSGELQEADKAAREAVKLGTRDAALHYHAGMIAEAVGDAERARKHLALALEINPHFSPDGAETARRVLEKLDAAAKDADSR